MRYNLDELLMQESVLLAIDILTRSPLLILLYNIRSLLVLVTVSTNTIRRLTETETGQFPPGRSNAHRILQSTLNTRSSGLTGSVGDRSRKSAKKGSIFSILSDSCPDSPVPLLTLLWVFSFFKPECLLQQNTNTVKLLPLGNARAGLAGG